MAFRLAEAYVQFSSKGLQGVNSSVRSITSSFTGAIGVAGRFAAALGIGGGGLGLAGMTMIAASFEQQMSAVRAVTGATADDFAALSKVARELGATTAFSATEAAQAEELLGRAGLDTQQIIDALPATLQLAQAGQLDLATSADITAKAIKGFGLEAREAGRIADVLAIQAASTNTSVAQMGDAMRFVAPVSKLMGVSVEETAAAIGVLSDQGFQGEMAGTGLRKILSTLADPTDDLKKRMGGLTVEADGMTAVLKQIGQLGVAEAFEAFGDRGGPAFAIVAEGVERIGELTEKFEGANGAADRISKTMTDNLIGSAKGAASAFQELILVGGEGGSLDAIRATVDDLTAFLRGDAAKLGAQQTGAAVASLFETMSRAMQATVRHSDDIVDAFHAVAVTAEITFGAVDQTIGIFGDMWSSVRQGSDAYDDIDGRPTQFADEVSAATADASASNSTMLEDLQFTARNLGDIWALAALRAGIGMANAWVTTTNFLKNVKDAIAASIKNVGEMAGSKLANFVAAVDIKDQYNELKAEIEKKVQAGVEVDPAEYKKLERLKQAGKALVDSDFNDGMRPIEFEFKEPELIDIDQDAGVQAILDRIAAAEEEYRKEKAAKEAAALEEKAKREAEAAARELARAEAAAEREAKLEDDKQKRLFESTKAGADKRKAAAISSAEELFARQVKLSEDEVAAAEKAADDIIKAEEKPLTVRERREQRKERRADDRGVNAEDAAMRRDLRIGDRAATKRKARAEREAKMEAERLARNESNARDIENKRFAAVEKLKREKEAAAKALAEQERKQVDEESTAAIRAYHEKLKAREAAGQEDPALADRMAERAQMITAGIASADQSFATALEGLPAKIGGLTKGMGVDIGGELLGMPQDAGATDRITTTDLLSGLMQSYPQQPAVDMSGVESALQANTTAAQATATATNELLTVVKTGQRKGITLA